MIIVEINAMKLDQLPCISDRGPWYGVYSFALRDTIELHGQLAGSTLADLPLPP